MLLPSRRKQVNKYSATRRRKIARPGATPRAIQTLEHRLVMSVSPVGNTLQFVEGVSASAVVATFTSSDPGSPAASMFSATIEWGDGTTTAGTVSGSAGSYSISGSHAYADETAAGAPNTLTITINDTIDATDATIGSTANVAEADSFTANTLTFAATEGQLFAGTVATFANANPNNTANDFTASIDWGDGLTTTGQITLSGGVYSVSGTHYFFEEGTQTIKVVIADDAPGTASATALSTASVANVPVNVTASDIATTEGGTFTGAVATFTDPGGPEEEADYSALIAWGDGTTSAGTIVSNDGFFTVFGSHLYAEEGDQTMVVTIIDDPSSTLAATASSSATATVAEVDVVAAGGLTITGAAQQAIGNQVVATFSDPAGAESVSDYTAQIDWGDGSTSAGTITRSGGTFAVVGNHTYSQAGSFQLVVVVSHETANPSTVTSAAVISQASQPIVATLVSPLSGFERSPLNAALVVFRSGDGSEAASDFKATINWGDGTTSTGSVVASNGSYTVLGSHLYLDEGTFLVRTTITRGSAAATVNSSASILEELLPNGTRGTADQRFISETYRDLFNRQIDPTALPFWGGQLLAGRSHEEVALDIVTIALPHEFGADQVQAAFQHFLHRDADPQAVAFLSSLLVHGATLEQLDSLLVGSDEYYQNRGGGTNNGFTEALFQDALHRDADPGALASFNFLLQHGATRGQLADFVFNSFEYKQDLVMGYYLMFLDRPADIGGLNLYATELKAGMSDFAVMAKIIGSDEYFRKVAN